MHRTRTTATLLAAGLLLLTACAGSGERTDSGADSVSDDASEAAISKACADDVHDLLIEEINGGGVTYRPHSCDGLTEKQWRTVVDEQAEKVRKVGDSLEAAGEDEAGGDEPAAGPGKAVFRVWGTAPGGVDITYGSDSENLDGGSLPMEEELEVEAGAVYYRVTAQLMGGGEIRCSVTVDGQTKDGRARGGYNICTAQLSDTGVEWR